MDKHLKSVSIKNFKGLKQLDLNDFNQINIIVGDNNIGKTNLLEAISLLQSPNDFNAIISISNLRNISLYKETNKLNNLMDLFNKEIGKYKFEIKSKIGDDSIGLKLSGRIEEIFPDVSKKLNLKEEVSSYGNYNENYVDYSKRKEAFVGEIETILNQNRIKEEVFFDGNINSVKMRYFKMRLYRISYLRSIDYILNNNIDSIIKNIEYKKLCIEMLKLFDSDIEDILLTRDDGYVTESIRHKKKGIMPLISYGDGIKKVLSLSNGIVKANNGILLIDEIETSIHSQYHDDIFKFIIKAAKTFNLQLFITTHSIEALDGLLKAQEYESNEEDIINVITLRKDKKTNQILSRTLKGRQVMENRDSFDFEVRL